MVKYLSFTIVVATLFTVFLSAKAQTNLILNGNFETGDLTSWTYHAGVVAINDVNKYEGTYGAEITGTGKSYRRLEQIVNVNDNSLYKFSFKAKVSDIYNEFYVELKYNINGTWTNFRYTRLQNRYHQNYTYQFSPPSGVNQFMVRFYRTVKGSIYVDDVELYELNSTGLSNDNTITTQLGLVNNNTNVWSDIPAEKIRYDQLMKHIQIDSNAQCQFLTTNNGIVSEEFVSDNAKVVVYAENGVPRTYTLNVATRLVKDVKEGVLDIQNFTISNINPALKVVDFKNKISLASGATIAIKDAANVDFTNSTTETIRSDMFVYVTGKYGTAKYTLFLRQLGNENIVTQNSFGSISSNSIQVPEGVSVGALINGLSVSPYATFKIVDSAGKELQPEVILVETDKKLLVRSESGSEHIYTILFNSVKAGVLNLYNKRIKFDGVITNLKINLNDGSVVNLLTNNNPFNGSIINILDENSSVYFPQRPRELLATDYLKNIYINGVVAQEGINVRVTQYKTGSIIIPKNINTKPLTVYSGTNFSGSSNQYETYTYHVKTIADLNDATLKSVSLSAWTDNVKSFKLQRGYYATLAQNSNGTGHSEIFYAIDEPLEVKVLPEKFNGQVNYIRVIPWNWVNKKGICGGTKIFRDTLNSYWYYNWGANDVSTIDYEFIPQKWGGGTVTNIFDTKYESSAVLGYNEPDGTEQANMTVDKAFSDWPALQKSGLRLGSPAVTDGSKGATWLFDFIDRCDAADYRVDFVAIHWYKGGNTATQLYNWLKNVHVRTGRKIWLTEWNNGANWTCCDPTLQEQEIDIRNMINMMDTTSFIERYSLYNWVGDNRMVFTNWNELTPAGLVYRNNKSAPSLGGKEQFDAINTNDIVYPNSTAVPLLRNNLKLLKVHPNPVVDGNLTLNADGIAVSEIQIYSVFGNELYNKTINQVLFEFPIKLVTPTNPGVYIVKVVDLKGEMYLSKFLVK